MNLPFGSPFLFTLVQVGAEAALKSELMRGADWRPSYSRPGFVTFKHPLEAAVDPDVNLNSVFAREYGVSLGVVKAAEGEDWAGPFLKWLATAQVQWKASAVWIHVAPRPRYAPGEEPPGFENDDGGELAVRKALAKAGWEFGGHSEQPDDGAWILDLVIVEPGEFWVGVHRHHAGHTGYPGGQIPCDLPDESPSRAYLKFVEAGRLWHVPFRAGDTVFEIGASPGGMSFAALERGLTVWGLDPGRMDPRVRATFGDKFHHLRMGIKDFRAEHLPVKPQWLVLDMNIPPSEAIDGLEHAWQTSGAAESAFGLVMVLKMNQWKLAEEIPACLERIRGLGMTRVRARQLPSNRQEITVYGETKKLETRKGPVKR